MEILVRYAVDINKVFSKYDDTALTLAIRYGSKDILECFNVTIISLKYLDVIMDIVKSNIRRNFKKDK